MIYTTRKPRRHQTVAFPAVGNIINELMNLPIEEATKSERTKYTYPAANVVKYDDRYVIALAVPGFSKDELSIEFENGFLKISSEREETEAKYTLREFNYGKFTRKFSIPEDVNIEKIEANANDGVLQLILPIIPKPEPRQITIK